MNVMDSRASYERDMQAYDEMFRKNPEIPFTFVFIDIMNLRSVNGLYGHQAGDKYIRDMAALLITQMICAEHIYRMAGDEFLAVYREVDEESVQRDIARVRETAEKEKDRLPYVPELAMGYAVSDPGYRSLRDVLRVADYMVFRNKADQKRDLALLHTRDGGTRLNLSGLTDRVFDAMCLSSKEFYPYLMNMDTNVTRISPSMVEFFGLKDEFSVDFTSEWAKHVHPDDFVTYQDDLTAALQGKKQYHHCKYRARAANGAYVQVTCRGAVYHGREGEPDIFSGYLINHGEPELVDPATGLQNGLALSNRLSHMIRTGENAVVLRLEVENINRIRMLYGTEASAQVQYSLARLLQELCQSRGVVYYSGMGAYTLVLVPANAQIANEIYSVARKICSSGISLDVLSIPVDLLGGAVMLPAGSLRDHESVSSAAMFTVEEARMLRRDQLHFFNPNLVSNAGTGMVDLLTEVHRDALITREHFRLRFQPIVKLETGELSGAEALVRWHSIDFGEVSPGQFISFLESDPAYTPLGYDIIRQALREAGRIRKKKPDFRINVNITAIQLYADDFIPTVLRILEEESFPANQLILELTERCKELDFSFLTQRVQQLHDAGILVALDDMGTGYNTIDLLLHLAVDEIKLDYAFTRELRENPNDQLYARVLCEAAANGHAEICFEGVESQEMAEYLKTFGPLLVQGFYFDHPLTPEEFEEKYCD